MHGFAARGVWEAPGAVTGFFSGMVRHDGKARRTPGGTVQHDPSPVDPWFDQVERTVRRAETHLVALAALVALLVAGGVFASFRTAVPEEWALTALRLVHLPSSWLAALLVAGAGFWAALGLVQERRVCFLLMQSMVPTGGMFAFLALWSGALASKGFLGVWWSLGPREVAELLLLAVYLLTMAIPLVIAEPRRADRVMAVIVLLGLSQVPIVFFSVEWLQMLAPVAGAKGAVDPRFVAHEGVALWPLAVCAAGFWGYATLACLLRVECIARETGVWERTLGGLGDRRHRAGKGATG